MPVTQRSLAKGLCPVSSSCTRRHCRGPPSLEEVHAEMAVVTCIRDPVLPVCVLPGVGLLEIFFSFPLKFSAGVQYRSRVTLARV